MFPGWPVNWGPDPNRYWAFNSAPVVGDVDGDGLPDIVVCIQFSGNSEDGEVRVYNRNGTLHPSFPKTQKIGFGAVPAIADLDLDGRNEIVVSGDFWNGVPGDYDRVWVFDLGGSAHGAIQWGQFMGGPKHQAYYTGGFAVPDKALLNVKKTGDGNGVVMGSGINCGRDCSEPLSRNTLTTLSATASADSVFVGWAGGGCDSSAVTCTLTVSSDTVIGAIFQLKTFTLSVTKAGTGSGTVQTGGTTAINCGTDCSESYKAGTVVELWALPDTGNLFGGWSDINCGSNFNCIITLNADASITATFLDPRSIPLIFAASLLPTGEVNLSYRGNLQISGGLPPYNLVALKGSFPRGFNLSPPFFWGTPDRAGIYKFTVQIADQLGGSVSQKLQLKIVKAVRISTKSLKTGRVNKSYNARLAANGGQGPYSWSLLSGTLPEGLAFDPSSGTISGTPTTASSSVLTFQVSDALGGTTQKSFALTVK
jgi:hypothetical protein